MIYVFGLDFGLQSFRNYLLLAKAGLEGVRVYESIVPVSYRDLLPKDDHRFFSGTYILTDFPWLNGRQIERLGAILRRVRESPLEVRTLNDPLTFPQRYELLRRLHEDGTNDHDVYRVTEHRTPSRWPVFIRQEVGHWHSDLLHDAAELQVFLEGMEREGVWRGDKVIVEFNDTRGTDGYYRRDSAFRIGSRIVPWRINIARHWWLRGPQLDPADLPEEAALVAAQLDYLRTNPHETRLMDIFERLGIEYGRMDYSMKDGRIQVWEVNICPDLPKQALFETSPGGQAVLREASELLYDAFTALDRGSSG
jgi:hypothetical protein